MKKIGKLTQKILIAVLILLILGTIGILVYPKIADQTDLDDKAVNFLAGKATAESEETVPENNTENTVSENSLENAVSDLQLAEEEPETSYKDSYLVKNWSDEDKQKLKTVYQTVLQKMALDPENLLFYEMKTIDGTEYYAFQVVDDFGGAYHDLLLYNPANYNVYWHDSSGYLDYAYSTDSIFSGTVPGNKDVTYEDDTWKKVFNGYMDAVLKAQDEEKATTYVDSSCYYLAKLSEATRDTFVDATKENQTFLIEQGKSLEERKTSKKISNYKWDYKIYNSSEYIDEYDIEWKELHIELDLDVTAHGQTEHYGDNYCVYMRQYEYGWRVAALTKES